MLARVYLDHHMKNLVPRLVSESEAKILGVEAGWYGTKMSGTFVTGALPSLEACTKAIDLIPEPPKVIDPEADAKQAAAIAAKSIHAIANANARSAYQIGHKTRVYR
jgi:hypothetical protein